MVFFTCNHCGESAKKPAVARHYQFKCRNVAIFVSCMDCQKDFKGEEYVAHTSCISEAEKYSGKDYMPKASHNAGLRKQETWLEVVRSILAAKDVEVAPDVRRVLQRLQAFDNVPRKKNKFLNFVSNSLKIQRFHAEPVWDVVEVALDKYKEIRFGSAKPNAAETNEDSAGKCNGSESANTNGHQEQAEATGAAEEVPSKKRKKSKENGSEKAVDGDSAPEKKKKKSKETDHTIEADTSAIDETVATIKKKKKRSKETEIDVSAPPVEEPLNNGSVANGDVPTKKKKKTNSESETQPKNPAPSEPKVEEPLNNGDGPTKKKKKTNSESETHPKNPAPSEPKVEEVVAKPGPFDWTAEIYKIVEKNDNAIDLEKLKKKTLKKYKKFHSVDEITHKVQKTFNKKLKKSGLLVVNNLVKTSG